MNRMGGPYHGSSFRRASGTLTLPLASRLGWDSPDAPHTTRPGREWTPDRPGRENCRAWGNREEIVLYDKTGFCAHGSRRGGGGSGWAILPAGPRGTCRGGGGRK